MKTQVKELIEVKPSSYEEFKWFHPEDYDEMLEYEGKKLLIFGMSDGTLVGFEYREGDVLKAESYTIYEVIY